ncbi:hypothetical protein ABE545_19230 [Sphingobacterium faecium]|uniref:hypothetical protein n=1 Tax=Sphingobacterium faecium TaxID=34087 RepID=UPI00320ACE05
MVDRKNDINFNAKSLWHGTSTVFLDSIRHHGLGAINIAKKYELIALLDHLYKETARLKIKHTGLENKRNSINTIISNGKMYHGKMELNYSYDGTFVSLSPIRASMYACTTSIGSELLDYCLFLLNLLLDYEPNIPEEVDLINIKQFLNVTAKPILIEVTTFTDDNLILEDGSPAQQLLNEIRTEYPKLPIEEHFMRIQFSNFKLFNPIEPSVLNFYEVEYSGHPFGQDFKPKFIPIK